MNEEAAPVSRAGSVASGGASSSGSARLARTALVCSLIGLPLCLWLFAAMMVEFGPDWAFQALVQAQHDHLRLAISLLQDAGLLLAAVGAVLGTVLLIRGRRRGDPPRHAGLAACVGAAGVLAVITGFASFGAGVYALFLLDVPGPAVILGGVIALIILEFALLLIARRLHRGGRSVVAS